MSDVAVDGTHLVRRATSGVPLGGDRMPLDCAGFVRDVTLGGAGAASRATRLVSDGSRPLVGMSADLGGAALTSSRAASLDRALPALIVLASGPCPSAAMLTNLVATLAAVPARLR